MKYEVDRGSLTRDHPPENYLEEDTLMMLKQMLTLAVLNLDLKLMVMQ